MSNEQKKQNAPQELRMGPGGRRGPGGPMGMHNVEKAKDKKKTLKRLFLYFGGEKKIVAVLLTAVAVMVACSVYAPKLQSEAIDYITKHIFDSVGKVLVIMLIVYGIYTVCSLIQSVLSAHLSQHIVKRMRDKIP